MFLGIDLGTGSVKALLLDRAGRTVQEASAPYRVNAPRPAWAESDPEDWWRAATQAVRACTQDHAVEAIGLSGQMHGVVLCDDSGIPLRPAILWADARSSAELGHFKALSEAKRRRLANPLAVGMAGVSLLWLRTHEPGLYRKARWALSPKDWLRLRLTGRCHSEPSDASATLMYDLVADDWAFALLDELGLRHDWLPPLIPSGQAAGGLTVEAASSLGLPEDIPVAAGAGDSAASLLGNGVLEEGVAQLQVGTGMQILAVRRRPVVDATLRTHLYRACGESWYAMAAMQNGGIALEWVRERLRLSWEDMYREGFAVPAGAEGLMFLPYLTGERTPHLKPDATGAWLGMRLSHTQAHFARAAFEGVAFSLKDGFHALEQTGVDIREIRLVGGGTRDQRWRQLLADLLQRPLLAGEMTSASARGAALLGGLACGGFATLAQTAELAPKPIIVAEPTTNDALHAAYSRFTEVCGGIFQIFQLNRMS